MQNNFSTESKQRLSEAHKRSRISRKRNFDSRKTAYEACPKLCNSCNKPLSWLKKRQRYCSQSCSARERNRKVVRNKAANLCLYCQKPARYKFCSQFCQKAELIQRIESGRYTITTGTHVIRRYLLEKRGHHCEKCSLSEWLGQPIALTVHHEDGNAANNHPNNLKLYCWNCHSLTNNFGKRNKNSSRKHRYS